MTLRPRGGGGLQTLFHSTHLSPSAPRAAHTLWHPACWTILVALRTSSSAVAEIGAAVEGRTLTKLMAIAATAAPKIKCIAFSCEGIRSGEYHPEIQKGPPLFSKGTSPYQKGPVPAGGCEPRENPNAPRTKSTDFPRLEALSSGFVLLCTAGETKPGGPKVSHLRGKDGGRCRD
jgi:hypothetical protein